MIPLPPSFHDRVMIAAGEDAATGSNKVAELLDQVAKGLAAGLTPNETATLSDYYAGRRFKRRPGEHKGLRRFAQGARAYWLLVWLKQLKEYLKHDPDEKAFKRANDGYDLNKRTAERAHALLKQRATAWKQEYGEDYVDTPVRSVASLKKLLRGG